MPRATWNGVVLAQAGNDKVKVVEGNIYFPPDAINKEYFESSNSHTQCFWKGTASYYDVVVDGAVNHDAAWYYPEPSEAAIEIKGHVAFWQGVKVESDEQGDNIDALDHGTSQAAGGGALRKRVSNWLQSLGG